MRPVIRPGPKMLNSPNLDWKEEEEFPMPITRQIMLNGFKVVGSDKYSKHLMNNVLQRMVRKLLTVQVSRLWHSDEGGHMFPPP
eukprot:308946-Pelagomonas_calceolata.AAC.1